MKVKELIELLQKQDPDSLVVYRSYEYEVGFEMSHNLSQVVLEYNEVRIS
jgi:hypothetical protein